METLTLYAEDGTQYRAFVHQERIDVSSMDGVASIPGMQTIRLQDGTPLNRVDNETFKNAVTGELLSRTPKKGR